MKISMLIGTIAGLIGYALGYKLGCERTYADAQAEIEGIREFYYKQRYGTGIEDDPGCENGVEPPLDLYRPEDSIPVDYAGVPETDQPVEDTGDDYEELVDLGRQRWRLLSDELWREAGSGNTKHELEYYQGDDMLVDEQHIPFPNPSDIIGMARLEDLRTMDLDVNNVLIIRDTQTMRDFYITAHAGEFTATVYGHDYGEDV